ncbi:MAG: phospholipid-binding protein MlaC [Geminicoccaceae bacterium]
MRQRRDMGERSPACPDFARRSVVLLAASALMAARDALADCPGAEAFIESAGQRTVAILNSTGSDEPRRLQEMADLMFEVADLSLIARLVLGRHWRNATEAQRAAYLDAFRKYALDSLASRFARLGGGVSFKLLGHCVAEDHDAQVGTEVKLPSRPEPVRIDWRTREADGEYRLVDVAIEGVSLVVSNRSEFDSVVSREGLDALIAQIQGKSKPRG